MSVKERVINCKEISEKWEVGEQIGSGSCGKTAVYKLLRITRNNTFVEECALKAVTIIEVEGKRTSCTEGFLNDYIQRRDKLVADMENEISLMYTVRDCPNIVTYKDYMFNDWEDEDGFGCDLYVRMDYYDVLRKRMRSESFTDTDIVKIGTDICNALKVCHRKNIIHRDIKPDNIFINENGDYLLGDFGISKIVDEANKAETRIGTYEYAAPEIVYAKDGEGYDESVDIYSLGLVLYELANECRMPFCNSSYAGNQEIGMRLHGKPFPAPSGCSRQLGQIILKACAYDKNNRYKNAKEFMKELNNLDVKYADALRSLDMSDEQYQVLRGTVVQDITSVMSKKTNSMIIIAIISVCILTAVVSSAATLLVINNVKGKNTETVYYQIPIGNMDEYVPDDDIGNSDVNSLDEIDADDKENKTEKEIKRVEEPDETPTRPDEIIYEASTNSSGGKILPKSVYLRSGAVTVLSDWHNPYDDKWYEKAYSLNKNHIGYIKAKEDRSAVGYPAEVYDEMRGHILVRSYQTDNPTEGYKASLCIYIKNNDGQWDTVCNMQIDVDGEPVYYSVKLPEDTYEVALHIIAPEIPINAYFY